MTAAPRQLLPAGELLAALRAVAQGFGVEDRTQAVTTALRRGRVELA